LIKQQLIQFHCLFLSNFQPMTLPNFIIIGAMKSGTTSLYNYLAQHPQIYMSSVKEPKFFALEGTTWDSEPLGAGGLAKIKGIREWETYQGLFSGVSGETAIGEASPLYIYAPLAAENIRQTLPHAKIVAILRHPVDRAYSHFLHWVQRGLEPLGADFVKVLNEEDARIALDWSPNYHYKHRGFYYNQLKRYYDRFHGDQIRIYLFEDLQRDPITLTQDLFHYLEVDPAFIPETDQQYNVSQIPQNSQLNQFIDRPNLAKTILKPFIPKTWRDRLKNNLKQKNAIKPKLDPELRQKLTQDYREDILKLQDLIQKDLFLWLN
jgi:Sulfotransferase domain